MSEVDAKPKRSARKCFKCLDYGHIALECPYKRVVSLKEIEEFEEGFHDNPIPSPAVSCLTKGKEEMFEVDAKPRSARKCFKCLDYGHIALECPYKRVISLKEIEEFEEGFHNNPISNAVISCSTKGKEEMFEVDANPKMSARKCFKCLDYGHVAAVCPYKRAISLKENEDFKEGFHDNPISIPAIACSTKEKDEMSEVDAQPKRSARKCFKCLDYGHVAAVCPYKRAISLKEIEDSEEGFPDNPVSNPSFS